MHYNLQARSNGELNLLQPICTILLTSKEFEARNHCYHAIRMFFGYPQTNDLNTKELKQLIDAEILHRLVDTQRNSVQQILLSADENAN